LSETDPLPRFAERLIVTSGIILWIIAQQISPRSSSEFRR
jgi:hypothetical protein